MISELPEISIPYVDIVGVTGSIPVAPTIPYRERSGPSSWSGAARGGELVQLLPVQLIRRAVARLRPALDFGPMLS
jgi:hypothetical protein